MATTSGPGLAVATLTNDAFVPATLVCLDSFLPANAWFQGDLVVLHHDLDPHWQDVLTRTFERLRLVPISRDLEARTDRFLEGRPDLAVLRTRFFCLDVFRLRGYRRVLFCDGDVLFRGGVRELFETEAALLAAGECLHYAGRGRDARTLEPRPRDGTPGLLLDTFNTGILSLGGGLLTEQECRALLDWLEPGRAPAPSVRMSFQAVANQHFAGRQQLVSGRFNYLLRCHRRIDALEGITIGDARVLHFAGPVKPWCSGEILQAGLGDPIILRGARWWQDAFARALGRAHLRHQPGSGLAAPPPRG